MSSKKRAHVIFSGRVQGVFFRAHTEEIANSMDLTGWVRNTPGGDVEAMFEGEQQDIERAISECGKGPPASRVDNIDVSWEAYTGEFASFKVRFF